MILTSPVTTCCFIVGEETQSANESTFPKPRFTSCSINTSGCCWLLLLKEIAEFEALDENTFDRICSRSRKWSSFPYKIVTCFRVWKRDKDMFNSTGPPNFFESNRHGEGGLKCGITSLMNLSVTRQTSLVLIKTAFFLIYCVIVYTKPSFIRESLFIWCTNF